MKREIAVLALTLCAVAATGALARPLFAFNTQNPRWEAPERYPPRQTHKPYRPLHLPPNELPPRQHRDIGGIKVGAEERALFGLVTIMVVITATPWLAAWLHVPAALWLLGFGALIGPLSGVLEPDTLFGNLLLPLISIGIGLMLFLDGLAVGQLRFARQPRMVLRLGIVGALVTCLAATVAASFLFELDTPPALLLGLIVALIATPETWRGTSDDSGHALDSLIAGEGTVARVAGAALIAVLLSGTLAGGFHGFGSGSWRAARSTLQYGLLFGMTVGALLLLVLRRRWIPERLARPVPLVSVLAMYTLANLVQPWSGFVAVITAAVLIGTQRAVTAEYVQRVRGRLHETIGAILLLSVTARLAPDDLLDIGVAGVLFVLVVLSTRPLAVMLSTAGTRLRWRGRLFAMILAPRGALALSLATICGVHLAEAGNAPAESWAPMTLLVVAGSMVVCALAPLAGTVPQITDAETLQTGPDRAAWPTRIPGRG